MLVFGAYVLALGASFKMGIHASAFWPMGLLLIVLHADIHVYIHTQLKTFVNFAEVIKEYII